VQGDGTWADATNATSSNNTYASFTADNTRNSNYLFATNFGFAIPSTATILGVAVQIERYNAFSTGADAYVYLVKDGEVAGNNKAKSGDWSGVEADFTYGGSDDLWGLNLDPGDINATNFGVALSVQTGLDPIMRVDHIRIAVTYTTSVEGEMTNTPKP
jgi:hypothetical protein